jgi:hypothetical protein
MLAWNTASCSAGVRRSSSAADITLGPMGERLSAVRSDEHQVFWETVTNRGRLTGLA